MRYALLLAVLPALFAADLKIDHATVAGSDVKKMQAKLEAVGIATVYGGPHSNHATEMALVSFPDGSYLEVMGIQPGADAKRVDAHEWAAALKGDAGPAAWAARVHDLAAEVKRLQAAGIKVSGPETGGRLRPDGVKLEWQTSSLGDDTRGSFFRFLIQDVTKREQRVYPQGKPVSRDFKGVTRVVIAVRSLEDAIKRYRAAFQLPAAIKQVDPAFGAQLALVGDAPVILAQPLGADSWLAARLERFGEGPCAFILGHTRGKYAAASKSRWFGVDISWFDPEKLGWRLGFEAVN
jgi:catechol 2,3-dioxygenase-like lactoylglutathione lyase family enzyme